VEERLAGRAVPGAAELAALEGAVRTLAGAAADAPVAEAAVATARRELGEAGARAAGLEAAVAAAALRGTEAAERAARSRGELDRVLCGVPLRERRAQVAARIGAAEAAGHATGRARLAARAAEAAQDALQALFASQGFAAAADAAAAIRSPERLDADEAAVRRYDDDLAAVRARLADPELAVDPGAPVDLCGAETGVEEAAKRHEAAVTEVGLLRERARQLDALVPRLAAAVAALGPLSARAESVRALAEVVAGRAGNRLQMPLATFVLAARLEEVAKAASARLLRMTSGRYCLLHTDASRDRRSRAGLALEVEDAWTGRRRDTATLSGGETFMTALALALGLADVVTAEAGGSTIDALFVDEGFGSLDPDSLDQVMGVLDELRSSGRLVGLVSHVAELRQRIPAQVLVRRGRAGSDVTVSWL